MQLYEIISSNKSAVWHSLIDFRSNISRNDIWRPIDDVQFVFLCGANIAKDNPSKRRKLLLEFSTKNLPYAKFFLAESIFEIIKSEGVNTNLLDIENDISKFADYIILVLESESTFCELGAFATNDNLRGKLIVINDRKHQDADSFINLGPIKAISERSNDNVIYYKMEGEGKIFGDGIGETFSKLYQLIHKNPSTRRTRITEFNPKEYFTKDGLRFLHDLIYFSGPISLPELSRVIKVLFPSGREKNIYKHLGLLCATKQIQQSRNSKNNLYSSLYDKPFFEYSYDIHKLMVAFKTLYYRYDRTRLKWN